MILARTNITHGHRHNLQDVLLAAVLEEEVSRIYNDTKSTYD